MRASKSRTRRWVSPESMARAGDHGRIPCGMAFAFHFSMDPDTRILRAPLADIERALIDAYLHGRGLDRASVAALPLVDQDAVLREASVFASDKLAEIEARWHYLHEIHE
jgi:hypothetical protein